jgi:hypothetical protein
VSRPFASRSSIASKKAGRVGLDAIELLERCGGASDVVRRPAAFQGLEVARRVHVGWANELHATG